MRSMIAVLLLLAIVQSAAAIDWVGSVSNDWFDPNNWNPIALPSSTVGELTFITTNIPNIPLIAADDAEVFDCTIPDFQVLDMSSGTLTVHHQLWVHTLGTFNQSGGDVIIKQDAAKNGPFRVDGTFNMTGGSLIAESGGDLKFQWGFFDFPDVDPDASITIENATVQLESTIQNTLQVALAGQTEIMVKTGGELIVKDGLLQLGGNNGSNPGASAILRVQGGTVTVDSTRVRTKVCADEVSYAEVDIQSGQMMVNNIFALGWRGSASFIQSGGAFYADLFRGGIVADAASVITADVSGGSCEARLFEIGWIGTEGVDSGSNSSTQADINVTISGGQVLAEEAIFIGPRGDVQLTGGAIGILSGASDALSFPEDTGMPGQFGVLNIAGGELVWNGTKAEEISEMFADGKITVNGLAAGLGNLVIELVDSDMDGEADVTVAYAGGTSNVFGPSPANGSTPDGEDYDTTELKWYSADNAIKHNVYFSTNENDVATRAGAAQVVTQGAAAPANGQNSNDPGDLEPGVSYYWAVDTLDNGNNVIATGALWSFTVDPEVLIDNFETDNGAWSATNGTVSYETDLLDHPGGFDGKDSDQSLQFVFNIPAAGQSTASLDLTDADLGWTSTDFDITSVEALGLRYHGSQGSGNPMIPDTNDVKLFVQLEDAGGTSNKLYLNAADPNLSQYLWDGDWKYFEVALDDFTGVNKNALTNLIIGVESRTGVAEDGTLFFDNAALFIPRCDADAHPVVGDVDNDDCQVTEDDLDNLVEVWLVGNVTVTPAAPATAPIINYPFEEQASVTTVADTSGNGFNATLTNATDNWINNPAECVSGDCFQFGLQDQVAMMDDPVTAFASVSDEITISFWFNGDGTQPYTESSLRTITGRNAEDTIVLGANTPNADAELVFQAGYETDSSSFTYLTPVIIGTGSTQDSADSLEYEADAPGQFRSQWNHLGLTKNSTTGVQKLYLNGELIAIDTDADAPFDGITVFGIGGNLKEGGSNTGLNYQGKIDEFKVYDVVLSQDEIASLAGLTTPFVQPTLESEDLDGDGDVDFDDYRIMASKWLNAPVLFP